MYFSKCIYQNAAAAAACMMSILWLSDVRDTQYLHEERETESKSLFKINQNKWKIFDILWKFIFSSACLVRSKQTGDTLWKHISKVLFFFCSSCHNIWKEKSGFTTISVYYKSFIISVHIYALHIFTSSREGVIWDRDHQYAFLFLFLSRFSLVFGYFL